MKRAYFLLLLAITCMASYAQEKVSIQVDAQKTDGYIDELLYGQLFEHIYFSANNGVWQELIFERSFEPEHYPGIHPRDGYFDGWFMDDEQVLHSPTRYEQPLAITSIDGDEYEITMDVNWRAYKLARRAWSGGLLDIRFAFGNQANGEPYYLRIHNPMYEGERFTPAQTESQIKAQNDAEARAKAEAMQRQPNFAISTMQEREIEGRGGFKRKVSALVPLTLKVANEKQINENRDWHKLRILCKGKNVKVYWDGKQVLSYNKLDVTGKNDVTFWVNYTETLYRNIRVASTDGKKIYFEGTPEDVKIPSVAHQWNAFGKGGAYELVKGDAVNMQYAQKITATDGEAGIFQGPQIVRKGEQYIGSIYAKSPQGGTFAVAMRANGKMVGEKQFDVRSNEWKKYEFTLDCADYEGDADFAIAVRKGSVLFDQVTMTTRTGQAMGGFRPDIFNAVDALHPTSMRWPGGGYVAQYNWKWGIGPQEERQRWPHWMWMDYDQNAFGTDEFIRFCREVNSEPVIVVSVGFDRPDEERARILQDACDWVAYCNEPATGKWGSVRAANGHPEPYNVKYWEIDNEMWEMGIEKYEAALREFSTAMRKVDPTIKIISCGGFPDDEGLLMRSGNYFDYLSLHHYEQQGGYLTGPKRLGQQYDRYAKMIAACPNPHIRLYISEWNLNSIDWRTGLFAGGFLNTCEQRDVVGMGAAALFIRRTDSPDWNNAFINFDYKDLFVAPNYQVTELWYDNFSKYRLAYEGDTKDLSVVTTLSEDGRHVIVKVVNATDKPYQLAIQGNWKGISGGEYKYYAPGDLMVANSMDKKDAVALKNRSIEAADNGMMLEVEPYSAGVLTIERTF